MSKSLNLMVSVVICFLGTQVFAQKTLSLAPQETKVITNSSLWKINATCHIQCSQQVKGKIRISVLKNSGTVNGKNLSTGQSTAVTIKNNSNISVSAESGTQVNLINLGSENVQAVCGT